MKIVSITFLMFVLSNLHAFTLNEAVSKLNQNENWQRSINQVLVSEVDVDIAKSGLFPIISAQVNYTKQDETATSLLGSNQYQSFLNITQPLFQGFKEFRVKKYAELNLKAQKAIAEATQRELAMNLTRIYFEVLQSQKELELLRESYNIAKEIEKEIGQRQKIGRSRKSELYTSQARTLQSKALIEAARVQLESLKTNFWRFLGEDPKEENKNFQAPPSLIPKKTSEILDSHPAIAAAEIMLGASKELIKVEKSDHYPRVGLSANYFIEQEGTFNQPDWNASLNLNFPIYEGGRTTNEIYRAKLLEKEAGLNLIEAQRNLKETLDKLHVLHSGAKARIAALRSSVAMSLKNYKELRRENELGLITSLEVMNGLNQYIQEKRAYNQIAINLLNYEYQLQALAGELN